MDVSRTISSRATSTALAPTKCTVEDNEERLCRRHMQPPRRGQRCLVVEIYLHLLFFPKLSPAYGPHARSKKKTKQKKRLEEQRRRRASLRLRMENMKKNPRVRERSQSTDTSLRLDTRHKLQFPPTLANNGARNFMTCCRKASLIGGALLRPPPQKWPAMFTKQPRTVYENQNHAVLYGLAHPADNFLHLPFPIYPTQLSRPSAWVVLPIKRALKIRFGLV